MNSLALRCFAAGSRGRGWRTLAAALAIGASIIGAGCSDRDRRLSEGEALRYKRALLVEHGESVSSDQVEQIGRFSGRTKREIDGYFERLQREHEREVERDRAAAASELRRERMRPDEL